MGITERTFPNNVLPLERFVGVFLRVIPNST